MVSPISIDETNIFVAKLSASWDAFFGTVSGIFTKLLTDRTSHLDPTEGRKNHLNMYINYFLQRVLCTDGMPLQRGFRVH